MVPGATVTVTETGKQTSSTYITDSSGSYTAPFLIPGTYELSVDVQGFRKYVRRGVVLQVNQRARVDVALELGTFAEATEVTALAPLTRSDSAEMGEVIEERAVRELPSNGRNFASLVYLAPGVTAGQINENLSGASTFNPRGASNFNALGSQANANAWLVDGIDNNEYTFNTVIVTPSVESVREFKVLTGTFSAEFGRGAGVVSVSTKSGNNDFHGTAFEYLRNETFDARNFFAAPPPRRSRPSTGTSTGPRSPGRSSATRRSSSWTTPACKETRGLTFVNTVPTAKTRIGDFSDYRTPAGALIPIYDPLTTRPNPNGAGLIRDPFPGNIIPPSRLNQVGLNVASIYPLPNGTGNFDNYTSTANREVTDHSFTTRLDHKAGARDSFFVRYSYNNYKLDAPQGQAACCLATPDFAASRFDLGPYVAGIQNTRLTTHGAAANWTHIFGPTVVNEIRLGFAKTNPETRQSDFGTEAASSLGIQGINVTEFTSGLPEPEHPGPDRHLRRARLPAREPEADALPARGQPVLHHAGAHSLKTGYRFIHRQPSPFTNTDTRSSISINRNLTNNPATNTQGSGIATLLLGYTTGGARGFLLEPYDMTNTEHSLFVQDDWKMSAGPDRQHRPPLRDLRGGHRDGRPARQLRSRGLQAHLRRRRRRQPHRQQEDAPQPGSTARAGLGHDRRRPQRPARRATGSATTRWPSPPPTCSASRCPYTISQNYSVETNPSDFSRVPLLSNPFPPIAPVKPRTTAELNAANPRVLGHDFENETPSMQTWQVSYERQLTQTLMAEVAYVGSKGDHLVVCFNPNEVQPGPGTQASRRLLQPLSQPVQHGAVRPDQQVELQQPAGQAAQALLGRPAVPGQLHVRQVARLRRVGGVGRRGGGQRPDRHPHGPLARTLRLRREAPLRAQLRLGASARQGAPLGLERRGRRASSATGSSAGSSPWPPAGPSRSS